MLSQRQQLILKAIIHEYEKSHHAVGSKILQDLLQITVSSATIRNEMVVLEQRHLLLKAHTSSGRMPSQQGYRYYLDHLTTSRRPNDRMANPEKIFSGYYHQIGDILNRAVNHLADELGYVAFAIQPPPSDVRLSDFRLIELDNGVLNALLATNDGKVTSQTFKLPKDVEISTLDSMLNYINTQMVGLPLVEILQQSQIDLPLKMVRTIQTPSAFLQLFSDVLSRAIQEQVYLGGELNLLDYDNVTDLARVKRIYQLLSSVKSIRHLTQKGGSAVQVQIGSEILDSNLKDFTLMHLPFEIPHRGWGRIGLLAPMEMAYDESIDVLQQTTQLLNQKIIEFNQS